MAPVKGPAPAVPVNVIGLAVDETPLVAVLIEVTSPTPPPVMVISPVPESLPIVTVPAPSKFKVSSPAALAKVTGTLVCPFATVVVSKS